MSSKLKHARHFTRTLSCGLTQAKVDGKVSLKGKDTTNTLKARSKLTALAWLGVKGPFPLPPRGGGVSGTVSMIFLHCGNVRKCMRHQQVCLDKIAMFVPETFGFWPPLMAHAFLSHSKTIGNAWQEGRQCLSAHHQQIHGFCRKYEIKSI